MSLSAIDTDHLIEILVYETHNWFVLHNICFLRKPKMVFPLEYVTDFLTKNINFI
jgi:hypothetical protein